MKMISALLAMAIALPAAAAAPADRKEQSRAQPAAVPGLDAPALAEAVWMLRSGLNVAALVCNDAAVVSNYNAILVLHGPFLNAAYNLVIARFSKTYGNTGRTNFDRHYTMVYNQFSNTTDRMKFCSAAVRISNEVRYLPTELLGRYAIRSLAALEPGVAEMLAQSRG